MSSGLHVIKLVLDLPEEEELWKHDLGPRGERERNSGGIIWILEEREKNSGSMI